MNMSMVGGSLPVQGDFNMVENERRILELQQILKNELDNVFININQISDNDKVIEFLNDVHSRLREMERDAHSLYTQSM